MKKKILKILSVIVIIILCISLFCINASADDFNDVSNYQVISLSNYAGELDFKSYVRGSSFYPLNYSIGDFIIYELKKDYNGFHILLDFPESFVSGQVITVSGAFILPAETTSFTINFGSFASYQLFDTSCKHLSADDTFDYYVPFNYSFTVSDVSLPKLDRIFFTLNGSKNLYGFGISDINFTTSTDVNGIVNGATNNIINNQNNNASNIQANQDKNTDKILNGDSNLDSSGETDKVNGAVGDIDGATDEALGGKSDSEIQGEVEGALDWNKIGNSVDFAKAQRMSTFYDRCLTVFGSKYNSLLLLSLILGLAAFLIGRKYG